MANFEDLSVELFHFIFQKCQFENLNNLMLIIGKTNSSLVN